MFWAEKYKWELKPELLPHRKSFCVIWEVPSTLTLWTSVLRGGMAGPWGSQAPYKQGSLWLVSGPGTSSLQSCAHLLSRQDDVLATLYSNGPGVGECCIKSLIRSSNSSAGVGAKHELVFSPGHEDPYGEATIISSGAHSSLMVKDLQGGGYGYCRTVALSSRTQMLSKALWKWS